MDANDFREYIIKPTLLYLGDYRANMEALLLGTAWHESQGCKWLHQLGNGPALGVYQIEPVTHQDQWKTYLEYNRIAQDLILKLASVHSLGHGLPKDEELIGNLPYATAIAWCKYRRAPGAIPPALRRFYARHFNIQGHQHFRVPIWCPHQRPGCIRSL